MPMRAMPACILTVFRGNYVAPDTLHTAVRRWCFDRPKVKPTASTQQRAKGVGEGARPSAWTLLAAGASSAVAKVVALGIA